MVLLHTVHNHSVEFTAYDLVAMATSLGGLKRELDKFKEERSITGY